MSNLHLAQGVWGIVIVRNDAAHNHFRELSAQLGTALELHMVVAFVSEQGARLLLELLSECTARVWLCTSLERPVSEPSGLELLQAYASTSGGRLRIEVVSNGGGKGFAHTKLYHFRHSGHFVTMIGSANLSQGGLIENGELSTLVTHSLEGNFGQSILKEIDEMKQVAVALEPELISHYKAVYEKAQSGKCHYDIDAALRQALKRRLLSIGRKDETKHRIIKIQMVKLVGLAAGSKIPETLLKYFPWLDEGHLPVIRTIQHHQRLDPENLWKLATAADTRLSGPMGFEAVSRIMHLYQPRRFAPVSEVFLQLLRTHLGLNPASFEYFTSVDYQKLCKTLVGLRAELKLKNIGEIESLLRHIALVKF